MDRLFQNHTFEVTHLRGCTVEALVGMVDPADMHPYIVLLKPSELPWQMLFLDIGAGFWEEWTDEEAAEQLADADETFVDYAAQFGLGGAEIGEIVCQPMAEEAQSAISIQFASGTLRLAPSDPHDIGCDAQISFSS